MAKFCKKCGVKHANRAFRCAACGTPFPSGRDYPDLMKYTRYILYSILPLAAAILLIIHFTGANAAAKRILKAFEKNDAEAVIEAYPEFWMESDRINKEVVIGETEAGVKLISENLLSYRLLEIADPSYHEQEALMESIRYYAGDDFDEDDVKNVKIVWFAVNMEHANSWSSGAVCFVMIKYDGSWYWWPEGI